MRGFVERGGLWVAVQVVFFAAIAWGLGITTTLPAWLRVLGVLLVAGGALTFLLGVGMLGGSLTPYPEPVPHGRFVDRGVYRYVRHPIYGGIGVAAVGAGLARPSLVVVALGALLVVFFWFKASGEERRLRAAYPEYAVYCEHVRARLIPFVL